MRYATPEQVDTNIKNLLARVAPGFVLMHWRGEMNHTELIATVCARQGFHTLLFRSIVFPNLAVNGMFMHIGVTPDCHHPTGLDRRVQMLMRVHPDLHIQHIDDEGYDEDESIFGYVAYDDSFKVIAWAPLPVDDEGMAVFDAPARITHTIPDGVEYPMQNLRENVETYG